MSTIIKKAFLTFCFILFLFYSKAQNCTNWLKTPNTTSVHDGVTIGDLDVTGDQLTVEATFNSDAPTSVTGYNAAIVSKHSTPADCNFVLRTEVAQLATQSNGLVSIFSPCDIVANKTYHVAMVYDGSTLKFYRNGFLMVSAPQHGNMITNDLLATIGNKAGGVTTEGLRGTINEVRIWNVARSQAQLRTYLNTSLPNPTTQTGLLAYYTFDNLLNKQGNTAWNGTLIGSSTINATNLNCTFIADSCNVTTVTPVVASFTTPDTVCVNAPIQITNTTVGASSYYWNFCTADINNAPIGTNLGDLGGKLVAPVYIDYVNVNGNYYAFSVNNFPRKLLRLDFGTSLLNTPTVTDLGTVNGIIPNNAEGIQIVNNKNNWYLLMVGGDIVGGVQPYLCTVQLGATITNNAPTAINWGNIGNLSYPHDLYVFEDNSIWYGLTVNTTNNTITRFNFTNDLSNTPTAVNLGNIGTLNGPTGIQALKDDNNDWHIFVTNIYSSTLSRLDFGSSLLNIPVGTNFGNINNMLSDCRDIYILKYCSNIIGYIVNGQGGPTPNALIKLDFNGNLLNIPKATNFGNIGNLNFPHSISKLFRVGPDVYGFIPNVNNSTITRLKFPGCTNSSISSSTLQNPPTVSYNLPGNYNINLTVDDGLPTQGSYCKQITVLAAPIVNAGADTVICKSSSLQLNPSNLNATIFQWTPATYLSNPNILNPIAKPDASIQYILTASNRGYCSIKDTINLTVSHLDSVQISATAVTCSKYNFIGAAYPNNPAIKTWFWQFGDGGTANTQTATHDYAVTATNTAKLVAKNIYGCSDSISIIVKPSFAVVDAGNDTSICRNTSVLLQGKALGGVTYAWQPAQYLNDSTLLNPTANISQSTKFYLSIKNLLGCISSDSVTINILPIPSFSIGADSKSCSNIAVQLTASGGTNYTWAPITGLSNAFISNPIAAVNQTTTYNVFIKEATCNDTATLTTTVNILPNPSIYAVSANDVDCSIGQSQLTATGAVQYVWTPADGLNNTTIYNPIATPTKSTIYTVVGKDQNGCTDSSLVAVNVSQKGKGNYYMPNAFTPNGDGLNDCFGIKYWGQINTLQFIIYDSYGKKVFYSENPSDCWDGTFNGQPQPTGNYIYYINAVTVCGSAEIKGSVILIR